MVRLDHPTDEHGRHDELGDPLPALERDRLLAMVDEDHLELSSVAGIDETWAIHHTDAMAECEARAGHHESGMALGDRHSKAGRDERPLTWLE